LITKKNHVKTPTSLHCFMLKDVQEAKCKQKDCPITCVWILIILECLLILNTLSNFLFNGF